VLRFGTDGLRGVANTELTPELALSVGRAAARRLNHHVFLVGRDTRRSGPMLQAALSAGLASEGVRVVDVGVIPTPGLAWLSATRGAAAAMISASHNPFPDNGIKLLSPAGTKLPDAAERAVEEELDALLRSGHVTGQALPGTGVGALETDSGAVAEYAGHLVGSVKLEEGRRLKVVCDCANGAASAVAPRVFSDLGVEATFLSIHPDGTNINDGCGSTHPETLAATVRETGADLGLGFDGDADRMLAVDHRGVLVDGDELLAMFARDLDGRGELDQRAIAVTVLSNLGLRRALQATGILVHETPVGDRHVADAIDTHGLILGGEQSGHIIFRRHATTGDGLLSGLKLLELLARRQESLCLLAAEAMTRLPQVMVTVPVTDPRRLDDATAVWDELHRVEAELGERGRVLLRASGTEPAVRVMAEAETEELAREVVDRLVKAVRAALGPGSGGAGDHGSGASSRRGRGAGDQRSGTPDRRRDNAGGRTLAGARPGAAQPGTDDAPAP
jgi:phosphoglucosamine mutase